MKPMKNTNTYLCPRCDFALIPVHAIEGRARRVIALTCPEPYCDHMQLVTRAEARKLDLQRVEDLQPTRQAN